MLSMFFKNIFTDTKLVISKGRELKNFGPWNLIENCLIFVLLNGTRKAISGSWCYNHEYQYLEQLNIFLNRFGSRDFL